MVALYADVPIVAGVARAGDRRPASSEDVCEDARPRTSKIEMRTAWSSSSPLVEVAFGIAGAKVNGARSRRHRRNKKDREWG